MSGGTLTNKVAEVVFFRERDDIVARTLLTFPALWVFSFPVPPLGLSTN